MGIDKSNPFDRDPSMEMEFGSGGRDIKIVEPLPGEKEGTSVQDAGTPHTSGHSGDGTLN